MARFVVGRWSFPSKEAARRHARGLRARLAPGVPVEGEDLEFLLALFGLHHDAAAKLGRGVRAVTLDKNMMTGLCFWVHPQDGGPPVDISYRECFRPSTNKARFAEACRRAADPHCEWYREQWFAENQVGGVARCPLTGEVINGGNFEIHHDGAEPFAKLVERFREEYGLSPDRCKYIAGPGGVGTVFADYVLQMRFLCWHSRHANLAIVSKAAHKRITYERRASA